MLGCDYPDPNPEEEIDEFDGWDNRCCDCWFDECQFINHQEDKDVTEHLLFNQKIYFPAILVIANTEFDDERITWTSVYEAKDNAKYGCHGDW